tara:strand:+ start:5142 stop:6854 length:1713 start_codon:yes stop_codon:yes gene_type:complete
MNRLLNFKEKILLVFVILAMILGASLEVVSIGFFLPFISQLLDLNYSENIEFINNFNKVIFDLFGDLSIIQVSVLFASVFILKNIIIYAAHFLNSYFSFKVTERVSFEVFNSYLSNRYQSLLNSTRSEKINNIINHIETFREFINHLLIIITEILVFSVLLFFLLFISLKEILFSAILTFIFAFVIYFYLKTKNRKWGKTISINREEKIDLIVQSFNLFKIIKVLNKENFFKKYFKNFNTKQLKYSHYTYAVSSLPRHLFEIYGAMFLSLFLIFAFNQNFSNQEILAISSIFLLALLRLLPATSRIVQSSTRLNLYKYPFDKIYEAYFETQNLKLNEISLDKKIPFKSIEFKNVSFKYNKNSKFIFNNINLRILKNDFIGIQGKSGSGKTTLVNLILGLLKPTDGQIMLNDKSENLNNLETTPFKVGYVTQEVFLMNKPIINNIAFGVDAKSIDIQKIDKILKMCNLEKFSSSEYYKDKNLGDSNLKISGGEKQRIGIARALYNDPDIIIFDEFTSSLDDATEEVLIENLNKLKEDKCFILISHKKKPLKYCKEIYNFEENQIKKNIQNV